MDDMIADMVAEYGFPVSFGAPIGHVDHNVPLIHGAEARLSVNSASTVLTIL
jgi:muramoyltetrapeptide carboxypeptidase